MLLLSCSRRTATQLLRSFAVILAATVMSQSARGQDWTNTRAWFGRQWMDSAGLTMNLSHVFELMSGTHTSGATPLAGGLTDLQVNWAPNFSVLRKGTFTATYSTYSQSRSSSLPDLQGVSNLAAPAFHHWREAYFETTALRRTRIKLGKVDANTEFAVVESAGDLSNASAGVNPTLFAMPSYPDGALSANVFAAPGYGIELGAGVYRSALGSAYYVAEMGTRWSRRRPGRLAAGVWSQRSVKLRDGILPATTGSYFIAEQTILARSGGQSLRAFGRWSTADDFVAPASLHNMYGASWTGFGSRRNDSAGCAFLYLVPAGMTLRAEKAYELYYKFPLTSLVDLRADVQRIRHPGGVTGAPAYTIASLRMIFHFSTGATDERN